MIGKQKRTPSLSHKSNCILRWRAFMITVSSTSSHICGLLLEANNQNIISQNKLTCALVDFLSVKNYIISSPFPMPLVSHRLLTLWQHINHMQMKTAQPIFMLQMQIAHPNNSFRKYPPKARKEIAIKLVVVGNLERNEESGYYTS